MRPVTSNSPIAAYLRGTVILCGVFLAVGIAAALIGVRVGLSAKRVAMSAIGAFALLFAARPPLWLSEWRRALGEWRARTVLLLTAVIALFLGLFAPLSWLRVLAG